MLESVFVFMLQGSSLVCLYKCARQRMNLTAEVSNRLFVLSVCQVNGGELEVTRLPTPWTQNVVSPSVCLFLLDFVCEDTKNPLSYN